MVGFNARHIAHALQAVSTYTSTVLPGHPCQTGSSNTTLGYNTTLISNATTSAPQTVCETSTPVATNTSYAQGTGPCTFLGPDSEYSEMLVGDDGYGNNVYNVTYGSAGGRSATSTSYSGASTTVVCITASPMSMPTTSEAASTSAAPSSTPPPTYSEPPTSSPPPPPPPTIIISMPTSTVTPSTTSSAPTDTPTTVSCPQSNGTMYTADSVQNAQFSLECGTDYESYNIEFPDNYKPPSNYKRGLAKRAPIEGVSFEDCVEFCAKLCDCHDIAYQFSTSTCQPKSAQGQKVQGSNDIVNARRVTPGCIASFQPTTLCTTSSSVSKNLCAASSGCPAATSDACPSPGCPQPSPTDCGGSKCKKAPPPPPPSPTGCPDTGCNSSSPGCGSSSSECNQPSPPPPPPPSSTGCPATSSTGCSPSSSSTGCGGSSTGCPAPPPPPPPTSCGSAQGCKRSPQPPPSSDSGCSGTSSASCGRPSPPPPPPPSGNCSETSTMCTRPSPPPPPPPPSTTACADNSCGKPSPAPNEWCDGKLNHPGQKFRLRTHVVEGAGNAEFENLYVEDTEYNSTNSIPILSHDRWKAGKFFYDSSTSSIALWHGRCQFSGLTMFGDNDMDAYSPAFINNNVGTHRMRASWGSITWDNDRFDGWVVCRKNRDGQQQQNGGQRQNGGDDQQQQNGGGKQQGGDDDGQQQQQQQQQSDGQGRNKRDGPHECYELRWHDAISNQGIDTYRCAKVELLTENV